MAGGLIDDNSFVSGIQWLISNEIMIIPPTEQEADDGGNVIPDWIKNNAGWWADGLIDDNSFVSGIQWLISNGIMIIPPTEQGADDGVSVIPDWIKNNAGWWAGGLIDDNSFVSGLQWLISNGIIMLESEVTNQDPDDEGRIAGGILTGENCNTEIDKDGDKVPDNLDAEGPIDWSHCTIEGRDLSNRDLSGANLSGANLYGAELDNTDLSGADLSYTVLYKASLANTVFTGANLSYANLCGATNPVVKVDWPGGTFHEYRYLTFDFTDTDLSYADFDHAQMQDVILTDAMVMYTNFHDANLAGADLSYKDLTGTILTELILLVQI